MSEQSRFGHGANIQPIDADSSSTAGRGAKQRIDTIATILFEQDTANIHDTIDQRHLDPSRLEQQLTTVLTVKLRDDDGVQKNRLVETEKHRFTDINQIRIVRCLEQRI